MPQNLRPFEGWIQESEWPRLTCPACPDGFVVPDGELEEHETVASVNLHEHEYWEPEWIRGTFTGRLKCTSHTCGERVHVVGESRVEPDIATNGAWFGEYITTYRLRFAFPALVILQAPAGTPDTVTAAIASAGQLLWADAGAAANRLRTAIEELLTARHVPRSTRGANGRRQLTTHNRIVRFKQQNEKAGEALEAVKWIGNSGSHASELSIGDVLDGAEMLGYALGLIYDKSDQEMQRRIRQINKSRGPAKKRR